MKQGVCGKRPVLRDSSSPTSFRILAAKNLDVDDVTKLFSQDYLANDIGEFDKINIIGYEEHPIKNYEDLV